jgi:mRNA interferase MazF
VYRVDLGKAKRGHEQRGRRYGIVVADSHDRWSTTTIVPTSTSARRAIFRPRLVVAGRETLALVDQVRTIDVQYIVGEQVDHVHGVDLMQVDYALSEYLGLRAPHDLY